MMRNACLAFVALGTRVGLVAAQTTTATILVPGGFSNMTVMASIASADSQKTVLVLGCPPDENKAFNRCLFPTDGVTVTEAPPSSLEFHGAITASSERIATPSLTKSIVENSGGSCTGNGGVLSCVQTLAVTAFFVNGSSIATTTTVPMTYSNTISGVVTITAGLEKIGANPTGSQSGGTAPTKTGSGGDAGPTSSLSTSSKPAAGPKVTQQAVLAGVAAIIGGALAL